MQLSFGVKVSGVRKLRGVESPEAAHYAVDLNCGKPPFAVFRLADAKKAPWIVFLRATQVFLIQSFRREAKVIEAVVVFMAVLMVDIFCRPRPGNERPRHAMRQQVFSADSDVPVSFGVYGARNGPSSDYAASVHFPNERTRFGIVRKHFAKKIDGWEHTEIMA